MFDSEQRTSITPSMPDTMPQTPATAAASDSVLLGMEDDEAGARIVREELKLLNTVKNALQGARARAEAPDEPKDDARLLEIREEISTARPDDLPALLEQMHNLGALRAQRGKGVVGAVDPGSPYFAHLRLEEEVPNGKPRKRDLLIGNKGYVDSASGVRVVDWRNAPVSKIFYRYVEGDDYEEELGDRIVEGRVLLRRSVAIVGGELRRVSTPDGVFLCDAQGKWRRLDPTRAKLRTEGTKAKLGDSNADGLTRADKVLPAIAAMIDKEQYNLITRPGTGIIAIQGSAGSGKTTVGLHRIAYLAETDPVRYRPERMMVVVPNEALIHYVRRVLPDLGVDGVPVTTFRRFATRTAVGLFPKLPLQLSEETPSVVSRAKQHPGMLRVIRDAVEEMASDVRARLDAFADKWAGAGTVVKAWDKTAGDALEIRLTHLSSWMDGSKDLGVSAKSLSQATCSALQALLVDARKQARAVLATWDEVLTNRDRLARHMPDLNEMQMNQVHGWCVRQMRVRAEGERDGETPSVDTEDFAILLRIWQELRGALLGSDEKPMRFTHLLVDEVQDASAVELRVLLDLTGKEPAATLAGDVAQRMLDDGDDRGEFKWSDLLSELGMETAAIDPLKVSYRSTAEITSFARGVLGPHAHDAEPIATRHGPMVELFPFSSQGEAVAFLADALKELHASEPNANVAIVARFAQQAQIYFEGLERAEVPGVRRVAKQDFSWEAGVDVTDVRQTKGLEFDEVVLVDTNAASYPDAANTRHALYVGATRASHQLWCIASDTPSVLVEEGIKAAHTLSTNFA